LICNCLEELGSFYGDLPAVARMMFFDEAPDSQTLIGAGVIILSGIYIVVREAVTGNSANTPVLRNRSRAIAPGGFRISHFVRRHQKARD
jgi:hypothetical protein